jgi:hypothetical protein
MWKWICIKLFGNRQPTSKESHPMLETLGLTKTHKWGSRFSRPLLYIHLWFSALSFGAVPSASNWYSLKSLARSPMHHALLYNHPKSIWNLEVNRQSKRFQTTLDNSQMFFPLLAWPTKARKDIIMFGFIIEYSSFLKDFWPLCNNRFIFIWGYLKDYILGLCWNLRDSLYNRVLTSWRILVSF